MYHITNANDEEQFEVADYLQEKDNVDTTTYADGARKIADSDLVTRLLPSPTQPRGLTS